ncbi:hypothetical protein CMI42_05835 [Candidatus Pacearchaeota archaeon]|nr:hypothetical protein [Candidatus Pacearchaeota archaeon]|tara:strand:- start:1771 stop:2007 length:237 start_codon:yes stop_codon:yes gene_type:complete
MQSSLNNNPNGGRPINTIVKENIVIDIGENGKILGIEIDCPSKFLDISSDQLNNLNNGPLRKLTLKALKFINDNPLIV